MTAQVLEHLTCMIPQLDRACFVQLARKVSGLYYSYAIAEGEELCVSILSNFQHLITVTIQTSMN